MRIFYLIYANATNVFLSLKIDAFIIEVVLKDETYDHHFHRQYSAFCLTLCNFYQTVQYFLILCDIS